jgi:KaiC/GvpD/RAD55 family RecA-like ATPase
MNNDGNTLVYQDQAAAENAVDKTRGILIDLLNELRDTNWVLDSLTLHNLIEKYDKAVRS